MSGRTVLTRALAILTVGVIPLAQADNPVAREKRVVIQGRVLSETGEGLANWPVLMVATQRYLEFSKYSSGGDVLNAARATTDRNGYFSIDVPKTRGFQFWFVRLVDPGVFDTIKYLPPEDVEVTSEVRKGLVAQIETTVKFHPDWAEVERRIAQAGGPETPKGKILRSIGLPEKTVETPTQEEWWYFTRGVVYNFRGDEPAGSRRFDPVKPPTGRLQPGGE